MTYIIIALIILAVGATAEIVAYIFSAKLLKKREEGLDRRKKYLDIYEDALNHRAVLNSGNIVSDRFVLISYRKNLSMSDVEPSPALIKDYVRRNAAELRDKTLQDVKKFISVYSTERPDNTVDLMSLIWVSKGGDINA